MAQYGDVLDIDIGYISKKLLPGVTNGTWTVKMILQEGKALPSFVFMKEEGEVWQVTHENQVNVCWKCGQHGHVGARCNQPTLTFSALDDVQDNPEGRDDVGGAGGVRSWAHVVKSGQKVNNQPDKNELEIQEELVKLVEKVNAEKAQTEKDEAEKANVMKAQAEKDEADKAKAVKIAAENIRTERVATDADSEKIDNIDVEQLEGTGAELMASVENVTEDDAGLLHVQNAGILSAQYVGLPSAQSGGLPLVKDDSLLVQTAGSAPVQTDVVAAKAASVKSKNKSHKKKKQEPTDSFLSESVLIEKDMNFSPSVSGIKPMHGYVSQATSKAGLTQDSEDLNSQDTSKAGLSQGSGSLSVDQDMFDVSEAKTRRKISPGSSFDSSSDSSPRHHKPASGQFEVTDLPMNDRSVANREWKANIAKNTDEVI